MNNYISAGAPGGQATHSTPSDTRGIAGEWREDADVGSASKPQSRRAAAVGMTGNIHDYLREELTM